MMTGAFFVGARQGRRWAQLAAGTAALVAATVLAGWFASGAGVMHDAPAATAMSPMTAVCLLLASAALWLGAFGEQDVASVRGRVAAACATAVALIGAARLLAPGSGPDGLMALNTAASLLLLGAALCLRDRPRGALVAQAAVLLVAFIAFAAFVGRVLGAPQFYAPFISVGMAAPTAFCLLVLGLGALASRPEHGVAALVSSPLLGGVLARRILPAAFLVPLLIGWARLWGQRRGYFGTESGLGLMIVACSLLLAAVTLSVAWALDRTDEERESAVEASRLSERRMAHALDLAGAAIVAIGPDQKIVFFDERAEKVFGYASAEVLARPLETLLPARFAAAHPGHVRGFAASPDTARRMGARQEVFGRRKDGSEFPAEVAISRSGKEGAVLFTAVVRDISERKRVYEETLRAERLEAANRELEAFSYSVSHDLRAPLRHIDGYIDMLTQRGVPGLDETSRRYLSVVADSAKRMGTLIDDLLSFSRTARAELRKTRVSLSLLLADALKDLPVEAPGRRLDWRVAELPEAECDPALMRQVFANLVGNAVKFTRTRDRACIEVGTVDSPGETVVFVRDNGVGFDMTYQDKLFGVFQRLHRQDEFEGTGIGLANVRRIIHRHEGRTWAESAPGKGATFYFSLPAIGKEAGT